MPPPRNADFSFHIVFQKGRGNPRRIFDAASELIDGFERLDGAVASSADIQLQPVMVLEDIEAVHSVVEALICIKPVLLEAVEELRIDTG